jgi:3,4-dehydroadipyl-CoA semialdehyde dehydrogenase
MLVHYTAPHERKINRRGVVEMALALQSFLNGRWQQGEGVETELRDPVTGAVLATASARKLDLASALNHARARGGPALQDLSYGQRGKLLGQVADVLAANRARYEEIAIANSGNTKTDAAIDIDGGIGTLKYYARLGANLGDARALLDQGPVRLAKAENYQAIHILVPRRGVAVHINAFNFPSWGLWEKAAVALLAGVPVLAKPASSTALLACYMVRDVIAARILPEGCLNLLCGGAGELLSHLTCEDVIAFTGSHETARYIRGDQNVVGRNVPVNIEADSINAALLGPDAAPGSAVFDAFIREVAREMTVKAGQKCTAIRRAFASSQHADAVAQAIEAKLAGTVVGDPRRDDVRMGPVVTRAQQAAVLKGIEQLGSEAQIICGGPTPPNIDGIDQSKSAFVLPTLLRISRADAGKLVHETEVFGPVATLFPFDTTEQAIALARRAGGSLVASIFSADMNFLAHTVRKLGSSHGRILAIDPSIATSHTGHGIVMPQCKHGGPGRAGNGEELGGLHGLGFYHQRVAIQGSGDLLPRLQAEAAAIH